MTSAQGDFGAIAEVTVAATGKADRMGPSTGAAAFASSRSTVDRETQGVLQKL